MQVIFKIWFPNSCLICDCTCKVVAFPFPYHYLYQQWNWEFVSCRSRQDVAAEFSMITHCSHYIMSICIHPILFSPQSPLDSTIQLHNGQSIYQPASIGMWKEIKASGGKQLPPSTGDVGSGSILTLDAVCGVCTFSLWLHGFPPMSHRGLYVNWLLWNCP